MVRGTVEHSVLFSGVRVGKDAKVTDSVVMPFAKIEDGAEVQYAIVAQNCVIKAGAKVIGAPGAITVIPEGTVVAAE